MLGLLRILSVRLLPLTRPEGARLLSVVCRPFALCLHVRNRTFSRFFLVGSAWTTARSGAHWRGRATPQSFPSTGVQIKRGGQEPGTFSLPHRFGPALCSDVWRTQVSCDLGASCRVTANNILMFMCSERFLPPRPSGQVSRARWRPHRQGLVQYNGHSPEYVSTSLEERSRCRSPVNTQRQCG